MERCPPLKSLSSFLSAVFLLRGRACAADQAAYRTFVCLVTFVSSLSCVFLSVSPFGVCLSLHLEKIGPVGPWTAPARTTDPLRLAASLSCDHNHTSLYEIYQCLL